MSHFFSYHSKSNKFLSVVFIASFLFFNIFSTGTIQARNIDPPDATQTLFPPLSQPTNVVNNNEPTEDWLTAAKKKIAEQEYAPTLQNNNAQGEKFDSARWHFFNRTHNLRAYVDQTGWEMMSGKQSGAAGWNFKYEAVSLSRANTAGNTEILATPVFEQIKQNNDRIMVPRGTNVVEWYQNSQAGLEQGFDINTKPIGEGKLILSGSIKTDLQVVYTGQKISFKNNGKTVFDYAKLMVVDAHNQVLPAYFDVKKIGDKYQLNIIVDDKNAVYPIVVDPLASSASWSAESDQATSSFGYSVSTAGDVNGDGYSDVIVGATRYDNGQSDEGYVFVYYGSASGPSATADWSAESDQASAFLGTSVSTAGDVNGDGYSDVIVGADYYDNGQSDEGAAFVWYGSASGLGATGTPSNADWSAESDQASAFLGTSVSTAGDVNGDGYSDVIVGADYYDNGQSDEGAAFVWYGSASGLGATGTPSNADWSAESDQASALLGTAVSTAGDVNGDGYSDVIVGADYYNNGQSDEGAAFVWYGSASGLGSTGTPSNADWSAESDQIAAIFGYSVSTAGDVNGDGYSDVIVGAFSYSNGQAGEGAAFVWYGSASGLGATGTPSNADWSAESDQASAFLGTSVSTAGDVNGDGYSDVIVGASLYDNGQSDEGAAFVWYGSASGLGATGTPSNADWSAEANSTYDSFGTSVSTAGDVNGDGYSDVIAGAPLYDNGIEYVGAAFIYYGSASGPSAAADWTAESNQAGAFFGTSVSTAGDVNGDGYSDVIVGASLYNNGQTDEGRVFVYYGSASGPSAAADWTAESNQAGAFFGTSVSTAGDVNGDGYSDVIVGAYGYSNGQEGEGAAFVWYGSASGLGVTGTPANADWTAESNLPGSILGISLSTAGDVNGDGYSDVIVGAPAYDNGQTNEGAAFVWYGSASGLGATGTPSNADWSAESDQADASFGTSVSTAGDVNGDGYSDVIVGAEDYDNGEDGEGCVFLYYGSTSGLSTIADWIAESDQINATLGTSVSTAGDVNGDGYSDVIVGAPAYDNGQTNEGAAFVWYGSASGLGATGTPSNADWTVESDQEGVGLGDSSTTAGDVNGDGYSDVIVGIPYYDIEESTVDSGAAFIWYGSASGLGASGTLSNYDWMIYADSENMWMGYSVASAGDVNGDGYSDVLVSVLQYTNGQVYEGQVTIFYGNSSNGLSVVPFQMNQNGQNMQILGSTNNNVTLGIKLRTPMGRTRARLWYENKMLGNIFDMTGLSQGDWADIDVSGITSTVNIAGLTSGSAYHWRIRAQYFPYLNFTPWFSIGSNGWNEADYKYSTTTIQFTSTTSSGAESVTSPTIEVVLSVTSSESVTVDYAVTGGTATGSGTDYTLASGTATISAGNTTTSIPFTVVDDDSDESNETIIVTLSNPSNIALGTPFTHTYTIEDDDVTPTVVQFTTTTASGAESVTSPTIEVVLSVTSSESVTVDYAVTGGTATGSGTDYTLASGTATISAGNTTTSIPFTVVDDDSDESNETIIVTLSDPSGATLGDNTTHTYTITDDDATELPTIQFTSATASGAESVTSPTIEVVLSATSSEEVTVDYEVSGSSTATGGGVDYTLAAGMATIAAGSTTTSISFTVVDDGTNEDDETVVVTLMDPVNATLGTNSSHTYTISNDDCPTVSHAVTYNSYPTCGPATCADGYRVSGGACVAIGGSSGGGGGSASPLLNTPLTSPLGGFFVRINNGATTTASRVVALTFNVTSEVRKMAISMRGDFTDASQENYQSPRQWDLCSRLAGTVSSSVCANGLYTVYVKFYAVDGRSSDPVSASITLNDVSSPAPVITVPSTTGGTATVANFVCARDLKLGMVGVDVKELQKYLNSKNFKVATIGVGSSGHESTYFGPLTQSALKRFQQAKGLSVTGVFDSKTRGHIGCVKNPPIIKYVFKRDLKLGMVGADVKELQKYLNSKNFKVATIGVGSSGHESTYFGPLTQSALKRFQQANNLNKESGWVGALTRVLLNQ